MHIYVTTCSCSMVMIVWKNDTYIYNTILLKVYVYGDIKALMEKDENVIYLSNHQCTGK
jgi:hypothetical protein